MSKDKDKVLGTKEIAERINRSKKTVRRYIKEGRIKAARQGERGNYGVFESEVRAYLARCGFLG